MNSWIRTRNSWIRTHNLWIRTHNLWIRTRNSWSQTCNSWIQTCNSWIQTRNLWIWTRNSWIWITTRDLEFQLVLLNIQFATRNWWLVFYYITELKPRFPERFMGIHFNLLILVSVKPTFDGDALISNLKIRPVQ